MSTAKLSWEEMFVGESHIFAKQGSPYLYSLVWHNAGSTLYILSKGKPEIDLRLEREICEIKVS